MRDVSDSEAIEELKEFIRLRRLKLPSLADDTGVKYRTLQNYLYGKSRMPIAVYIKLCLRVGMPPEYPMMQKFYFDFYPLTEAVERTFGILLEKLDIEESGRIKLLEEGEKRRLSVRQTTTSLVGYIQRFYDEICLRRYTSYEDDEDDPGTGNQDTKQVTNPPDRDN